MSIMTITYEASDTGLTVTDGTLAAGIATTSAIYENGVTGSAAFVDILVGGEVTMGATPVVGDTVDIFICAQHTIATATDMTGGIGANLTADALAVESTDFARGNLIPFATISMEGQTPADDNLYHWGPRSVAAAFGGVVPKHWMLLIINNTAGTTTAIVVNTLGVQYTST